MLSDPIIQAALRAVESIEEFCNGRINPREPDAAYRAQCLFRELAKPVVDAMCDYMATRPVSPFQIPVFQYDGKLYPIRQVPD